jgi:hypothetical protein
LSHRQQSADGGQGQRAGVDECSSFHGSLPVFFSAFLVFWFFVSADALD